MCKCPRRNNLITERLIHERRCIRAVLTSYARRTVSSLNFYRSIRCCYMIGTNDDSTQNKLKHSALCCQCTQLGLRKASMGKEVLNDLQALRMLPHKHPRRDMHACKQTSLIHTHTHHILLCNIASYCIIMHYVSYIYRVQA